ncbi:MAG: hypothetical protein ACFFBD_09365 [Candidatus Hodarchaeota archaeon]
MSGIAFPTERLTRLALRRQTNLEKVAFIPIISVSKLNVPPLKGFERILSIM